jgi:hypothetical protein
MGKVKVETYKVDFNKLREKLIAPLPRDEYVEWLHSHGYGCGMSVQTKCKEVCEEMLKSFPDLILCRGLAWVEEPHGLPPTKTPHWWLQEQDGTIVDPTAHQYPTKIIKYEWVDPDKGEPTGKCPNCGSLRYDEYFCSKDCEIEYMADLL